MKILCIARPRLGVWVRTIIVVLIYLVVARLEPDAATPLAGGAILGVFLASGSASSFMAWAGREVGR